MGPIRESTKGVEIRIRVVAGASRDRLAGTTGDCLKLQITAAPEKGRANAAILSFLAAKIGVRPGAVTLLSGHTSPRKRVLVSGVSMPHVLRALDLPQP